MSDDAALDREKASCAKATRHDWIGRAVISLPCLPYSMDMTVPQIAEHLKPSSAQLL